MVCPPPQKKERKEKKLDALTWFLAQMYWMKWSASIPWPIVTVHSFLFSETLTEGTCLALNEVQAHKWK